MKRKQKLKKKNDNRRLIIQEKKKQQTNKQKTENNVEYRASDVGCRNVERQNVVCCGVLCGKVCVIVY